jgi:diguanylate cyclase (GGDEF)-like protein/PAS domain S-box-containing protein
MTPSARAPAHDRAAGVESAAPAQDESNAMPELPVPEEFHKAIVDNIADGVYYVQPDRTIRYWNPGAQKIAGFAPEEIVGRRCFDNLLAHVDSQGNSLCHSTCPLAASMKDGETREATVWLRHRDGHRKPVRIRTAPVRDGNGAIIGGVETFSDATAVVRAAEDADQARHEALTDELTGLPNRRMFDTSLRNRLDNLTRYHWQFGLLVVDIDFFKAVNDQYGHAVGDAVLVGVARTLAGAIRGGDVVARWGGEEFAVLVEASDAAGLHEMAERLRLLVANSEVRHEGLTLPVYVSVGGALASSRDDPESLFERADRALYSAKADGRNRTAVAG